jgi:hypothetical protein
MANKEFAIDWSQVKRFGAACLKTPVTIARHLARGLKLIGKSDITKMRSEQLSGGSGLNVRFRGLKNSFKFKSTDDDRAFQLNKLFLDEYTRWPGARIFQTGGTITPKRAKNLTVLMPSMRGANGKRKVTQKELRALIDSKQARIIPTARGALIIREKASLTKKGKLRKGARTEILAVLSRHSRQQKRLSFFENFQSNQSEHNRILDEAVEKALQEAANR